MSKAGWCILGVTAAIVMAWGVIGEEVRMRVPDGFRSAAGITADPATGWAKEIVQEKTGIEMVLIPAGTFQMGSPANEEGRYEDEGPVHTVRITKPFYMGKYEVTQAEWQKVMGNNPSNFKGSDRLPAEQVLWNDCQEFAGKAGDGLRLPTEAEWEYACRAGTTTRFSFGDSDADLGQYGWYDGNSGKKTHEVGTKQPNGWGLYDMHGNVWEWCSDWLDENCYRNSPDADPTVPAAGQLRVLRGGSWFDLPSFCRSAGRVGGVPDFRYSGFGFRVVRAARP